MTIDIDNWVGECDKCQRKGKPLAAVLPLENIKVSAVWELGREFVNELNNELCTLLHIERSVTAAYHPQTNGLDEKTNHNIKQALTTLVNDRQNNWDTYLKGVLFALRSKVHTSTKQTPFRLLYGREAVFPAELPVHVPLSITLPEEATYNACIEGREEEMKTTHSKAEKKMAQAHEKQRLAYAKKTLKKYRAVSYSIGQEVLLFNMRKKGRKGGRIEPDFSGPFHEMILMSAGTLSPN
uniref:Integrase catalytic domain-containing protein n=1 Tax=Knipowitschia caucasica TaxID=637954 RepID=A0AAV2LDC0_KNICA